MATGAGRGSRRALPPCIMGLRLATMWAAYMSASICCSCMSCLHNDLAGDAASADACSPLLLRGARATRHPDVDSPKVVAAAAAEAAAACSAPELQPLYSRIDEDLRHWRGPGLGEGGGITAAMMDLAFSSLADPRRRGKAIGVAFRAGEPYVVTPVDALSNVAHHAALLTAHVQLLYALHERFGTAIPDVEFVVGTADMPAVRLDRVANGSLPLPVLRFCKSEVHADILVPDIHFQVRG
eukprot:363718-Chlamydomonas_euryale.AAC.1